MPTTPAAIAIFLLMVFPGIVLELLRLKARPGRRESIFTETSRILVGGVALSATSLLVLGGLRSLPRSPLPDPRAVLTDKLYVPDHLWSIGLATVLFLTLSTTFALLYFQLTPRHGLPGVIEHESAWVTVFARLAERAHAENADALRGKKLVAQVQVDLEDGSGYIGIRESFSADPALEDREIVLAAPLYRVSPDGERLPATDDWERVIITQDRIRAIRVRFVAEEACATDLTVHTPWIQRIQRLPNRLLASPGWTIGLLAVQIALPAVTAWLR